MEQPPHVNTPTSPAKPRLIGTFFTKTGQILTREQKRAAPSLVIPMNLNDPRLFIQNGQIVSPFVKVTFRHVRNVPAAGFMLAIYEESAVAEFDPTGLTPVTQRSLEQDFAEMNAGADV